MPNDTPAALAAVAPERYTMRMTSTQRGILGMLLFLGTEVMFFAGLISAFLILRAGAGVWPPPDQPRLPIAVTGFNTAILLMSGCTMVLAGRAVRKNLGDRAVTIRLAVTAALGGLFLGVQGYEWVRLVGYGLSLSSGSYGSTFYTLIGAHGVHVVTAVLFLLVVLRDTARARLKRQPAGAGIVVCEMYWLFVVAVWPVLYVLVYLS